MINEATSISTLNPIFILDHAIPKNEMDPLGAYKKGNGTYAVEKSDGVKFKTTKVLIKNGYRYETGQFNKSEFCLGGVLVFADQSPANWMHYDGNNDFSQKIVEIKKSDVESNVNKNVNKHFSDDWFPYTQLRCYYNTFERDWNRTVKYFGQGNSYSQEWIINGNARYTNDWYMWIPSTVSTHWFHFEWFSGSQTVIPHDSWKSTITISKI